MEQPDVTVEVERDGAVTVQMQRGDLELILRGAAADFDRLSQLASADWTSRQSIQAGQCLGSRAWWSSDDKSISLLIGPDDESWDVAVQYPTGVGDLVVAEVRAELTRLAERVTSAAGRDESEEDLWLQILSRALPHPQISDLLFWPERVVAYDAPHTPARAISLALAYRPIEL